MPAVPRSISPLRYLALLAALAILGAACGLAAAPAEASPASAAWTTHGPATGEEIDAIAYNPANPKIVYAGGGYGALKSTDGGKSWRLIRTGLPTDIRTVGNDIAVDPVSPSTVYLATSQGLFKSTNAGKTWTASGTGLPSTYVTTVAIDPARHTTLYAGTDTTSSAGVSKSTDGGKSWTDINGGLPLTQMDPTSWAFDPANTQTIYLGTRYTPFKSTDGGQNWVQIANGLSCCDYYIQDMAIDPSAPATLYMAMGGPSTPKLYKTTDGGSTWKVSETGIAAAYVRSLAVDPAHPATVFAGGGDYKSVGPGVFRSTDRGAHWAFQSGITLDEYTRVTDIAVNPASSAKLLAGTCCRLGGVYASASGGKSWAQSNAGFPADSDILAVAVDPANPKVVYAGGADVFGVYKSTTGGSRWATASAGIPFDAEVYGLAVDPSSTSTLYAATRTAGLFKSTNGAKSWSLLAGGLPASPMWAVAVDPGDSSHVLVGTDAGLYQSSDGGTTFSQAVGIPGTNANLSSIVFDPTDPSIVYSSSRLTGVYKSLTGGSAWANVSAGLQNPEVYSVAIDPKNTQTLYAAVYSIDGVGGMFKSTNAGVGWLASGLQGDYCWTVAVSPTGAVYAGTQVQGAQLSTDGGASWSAVNEGLNSPYVYSFGLTPDGSRVHAGTGGAGVGDAAGA